MADNKAKRSSDVAFMSKVSKDLVDTKFLTDREIENIMKRFYKIMSKYDIRQGTYESETSLICNNYEWTICTSMLISRIVSQLEMEMCFLKVPENLKGYTEK